MKTIDTMKCPACGSYIALYRLQTIRAPVPLPLQILTLFMVLATAAVAFVMLLIFAPDFSNDILIYWIRIIQTGGFEL